MSKCIASAFLLSMFMIPAHALAAKASSCGNEEALCHDSRIAADVINLLEPIEQSFVTAGGNHPTRAIEVAAHELIWQRERESNQL